MRRGRGKKRGVRVWKYLEQAEGNIEKAMLVIESTEERVS